MIFKCSHFSMRNVFQSNCFQSNCLDWNKKI